MHSNPVLSAMLAMMVGFAAAVRELHEVSPKKVRRWTVLILIGPSSRADRVFEGLNYARLPLAASIRYPNSLVAGVAYSRWDVCIC